MIHRAMIAVLAGLVLAAAAAAGEPAPAGPARGVFVRFQLDQPAEARWYVRLGGYIHNDPWYLPKATVPAGADRDAAKRLASGQFTEFFDLAAHAGKRLHGRLHRSGGVAEFPNVTAEFIAEAPSDGRGVVIELATAPDERHVVKRFAESFRGTLTSFLVSPDLAADADSLETAAQMTARRLRWAEQVTGSKRHSPQRLLVQTSFWSPQRPELNLQEARVLWLLGFNVVGNQMKEVREKFALRAPGHTHNVKFGPGATREQIDALMKQHAARNKETFQPGVPFNFADEVVCRPPIGTDPNGLAHFHAYLAAGNICPADLGAERLADVAPIETPDDFHKRAEAAPAAAARVFYHTSRFRQAAATQRVRWHTEAFHRHFAGGAITSTLVADHPYFGGTGLGMGMVPNSTWGGAPLAMDWFDLARKRAVDLAGIEDWMGLQFMYGPNSTWEGFQLMGFQAAIFRAASRGEMPIMAWITPSDETNLRLKTASALCQGATHFFYWTYGPTATSTENYWSDLRSAYDGIAAMTRQLAAAEGVLAEGKMRKTRLALLYSISADLWQPTGYVHMLERRATYLSLVHDQYLVDMLTEQDVEAGRLSDYDVLYVTDPCITSAAATAIREWVRTGGSLYGSCAAGSRNEFGEPAAGLAEVFGIAPEVKVQVQPGRYHIRGALNGMSYLDEVRAAKTDDGGPPATFGVIGAKVTCRPAGGSIRGTFRDGGPAVVTHAFGNGHSVYVAACPGIAYLKEAHFVPVELKEKWPAGHRQFLNAPAAVRRVPRVVELSSAVMEAGVYDTDAATALVLANFTYEPIAALKVRLRTPRRVATVRSAEHGKLPFTIEESPAAHQPPFVTTFALPLGLNDVLLLE